MKVAYLTTSEDVNADSYDFNDHAYRRFVEKLKLSAFLKPTLPFVLTTGQDAVDPNGILSPGKQGMWPGRYRSFRDPSEHNLLVAEQVYAKLEE